LEARSHGFMRAIGVSMVPRRMRCVLSAAAVNAIHASTPHTASAKKIPSQPCCSASAAASAVSAASKKGATTPQRMDRDDSSTAVRLREWIAPYARLSTDPVLTRASSAFGYLGGPGHFSRASSARRLPIRGANLKPWPLQGEPATTEPWRSTTKSSLGVFV